MTHERWIALECHPVKRCEAVRTIEVLVSRSAAGELRTTFRLDADLRRLRVPRPGTPRIANDLWRHTCFEAFIAIEGQTAYSEFNFAPSGEWAVYAFNGYRESKPVASENLQPLIAVRSSENRLVLDSVVTLDKLSAIHSKAVLRIGLCSVIEANDGISYWALRHPIEKPDFHHADGFALRLEPPELESPAY